MAKRSLPVFFLYWTKAASSIDLNFEDGDAVLEGPGGDSEDMVLGRTALGTTSEDPNAPSACRRHEALGRICNGALTSLAVDFVDRLFSVLGDDRGLKH